MKVMTRWGIRATLCLIALLACAGNVSAQFFWAGAAFGSASDEWLGGGTNNQWGDANFSPLSPPGSSDFAVILDSQSGGTSLLPYPHIRTDVGTVGLMTLSPNGGQVSELTIETGGSLLVGSDVHLAEAQGGGGGSGTLFMTGGDLLVLGNLFVGQGSGQGQIHLNAGFVQATTVSFNATGNIDLELGASFFLDGDQTASVPGWVTDGSITAIDGTGTVGAVFDGGSGRTVITAQSGGVLAGDYNDNGTVDAADYTEWLDNLGASAGTLPNDADGGVIGQSQYNTWKTSFGSTSSAATGHAVPEPASLFLFGLALLGFAGLRRRS